MLIQVYEEQAHKQGQGKKGWSMPFPPLLKRLREKTEDRLFCADQGMPYSEALVMQDMKEGWVDEWVGR